MQSIQTFFQNFVYKKGQPPQLFQAIASFCGYTRYWAPGYTDASITHNASNLNRTTASDIPDTAAPSCMAVLDTQRHHRIPSIPPSAMCRHSPSPISKSAGKLLQPALFSVPFRHGKGQALSRAMRCSFFKCHDEYTDRINVYAHHDRSENQQEKPALPNINGSRPVRTAYDCNCKRTI